MRDFVAENVGSGEVLAMACHGGVTVDLLRTLLGDDGVPPELVGQGTPSGAITTLDGLEVVSMASVEHLRGLESVHRA